METKKLYRLNPKLADNINFGSLGFPFNYRDKSDIRCIESVKRRLRKYTIKAKVESDYEKAYRRPSMCELGAPNQQEQFHTKCRLYIEPELDRNYPSQVKSMDGETVSNFSNWKN